MRVAVVGLGYVGLVTATCLARLGQDVDGLESDPAKVETLSRGEVPYYEPHLASELTRQFASGRLRFTTDAALALRHPDVVLICVGTPSDPTGHADLRHVLDVTDAIGRHVETDAVVALRSTVPVGTTRLVERRLNEALAARGKGPVAVLANPEFLRTGRAIEDFLRPTRVVIGRTDLARDEQVDQLVRLYAGLESPLVLTDAESAELVKNASNTFLAMKISFANELAALCEATGASIDDVVQGMALDPRIGPGSMKAGIGYGGSCLPKDVRSLIAVSADHGVRARVAEIVDEVNRDQPVALADRLAEAIGGSLDGCRIGLLGLAFKPETDDIRESPALTLARVLRDRGAAVVGCDPEAGERVAAAEPWLEQRAGPIETARDADAVILATEWPAYVTIDPAELAEVMRGTVVVDGRNVLDRAKVEAAGLRYLGIGRGVRRAPGSETPAVGGNGAGH